MIKEKSTVKDSVHVVLFGPDEKIKKEILDGKVIQEKKK